MILILECIVARRLCILFAGLVLIAAISAVYLTLPWQEGVCKLRTTSSVGQIFNYSIDSGYATTASKPDSLADISEDISGAKHYFTIPFKDRKLLGCLVVKGKSQYTVYADLNGNNSLADEEPLAVRHKKNRVFNFRSTFFGPASLKGDTACKASFYLFITNHVGSIHVAPARIKTGKIRINGQRHKIALADLDYDGKYKTHFTPASITPESTVYSPMCDRLSFDCNLDGKAQDCYFIAAESGPLPKLILINDQYYSVEIKHNKVLASPATPALGTLKLNTHNSSMHLYSDTYRCMIDSKNAVELPAGDYTAIYAINRFADANGDIWEATSKHTAVASFRITDGLETAIDLPTSFSLKTSADLKNGNCDIGIKLFSTDNTEYSPALSKAKDKTAEPVINIVDEKNNSLHVGTMEYG